MKISVKTLKKLYENNPCKVVCELTGLSYKDVRTLARINKWHRKNHKWKQRQRHPVKVWQN